jgi:hypothetical protein
VRVTKTDNRGHNCHPAEMQVLWDFLKHYKVTQSDDGTQNRYYSPSAFAANDAVAISSDSESGGNSSGCDTGLSFSFAAIAVLLGLVVLKKH